MSWDTFLKRFTYKPGWTFYHDYDIDNDRHILMITMRVEDSYHPENVIQVSTRNMLPRYLNPADDEQAATCYLLDMIRNLELHEMDEWLKKDGVLLNDPHAIERINV